MAVLEWLNQNIAQPFMKAGQWLGQNIISPALDWAKKIPLVGDVVRAAEPLTQAIGKGWNYATAMSEGKKGQELDQYKLTGEDIRGAVGSALDTATTWKGGAGAGIKNAVAGAVANPKRALGQVARGVLKRQRVM